MGTNREIDRQATLRAMFEYVCNELDLEPLIVRAKSNKRELVTARQIYSLLASNSDFGFTEIEIGQQIGKDRTTILHSFKQMRNLLETNSNIKNTFYSIESGFNEQFNKQNAVNNINYVLANKVELMSKIKILFKQNEHLKESLESVEGLLKDKNNELTALHAQVLVLQSENKMLKDLQNNK